MRPLGRPVGLFGDGAVQRSSFRSGDVRGRGEAVPSELDWSDLGPLAAEFVRLSEELLSATTVHGVLERVVTATRSAVPGADLVSVTLRTDDGYTTPVYTDELALKLDEVQYELGEGPCVE